MWGQTNNPKECTGTFQAFIKVRLQDNIHDFTTIICFQGATRKIFYFLNLFSKFDLFIDRRV